MKEKENEKPSRFRPEELKAIGDVFDEKWKKISGMVQVPDGYSKCPKCGRLFPDDVEKCPYCIEPEQPVVEKEKDGSGGIISMLEDDED